jgi:DNA polymerase III subunit gamma/tau
MSYLALARKWRPRTFSQLVGQEHINKALINTLNQRRLHHAYLFTGTRGVGKTSVARILAKALNCETGISAEPCLQCDACIAIEQGRFIDLIEIDGASKTKVEDTRDLLDNVQYAPTSGRYKIYLIDEVHMLSQHSFNALLKTLEEPPAHVIFILATTDPQKLPVTVLSRCLQFGLKHLSEETIYHQLAMILQDEQLAFEEEALHLLARAARGSMRDALSLLDQAITSCDNRLNAQDVKMILGYTRQDYALQLLQALAEQNPPRILEISQQISIEGGHFTYVIDELLSNLHQLTILQCIGDVNPLISPSDDIKALVNAFSPEDVQLFYQIALKGREELELAPTMVIGFTMTLLRMLTFRPTIKVAAPPLAFEKSAESHPSPDAVVTETPVEPTVVPTVVNEILTPAKMEPSPPEKRPEDWSSIIDQLSLTGLALNAVENAELISKDGRDVKLNVAKGHQSLFTPATLAKIEQALSEFYQSPIKVTLTSNDEVQSSPAQQKIRLTQEKQQYAEIALQNDPLFQQLQQEFSAELVKNSIVPLKDDI